jgi:hypothetical protein
MLLSAASVARRLYRTMGDVGDQRRGRQLAASIGRGSDRPAIYFLSPDYQRPAGGIRVIYRHVEILNQAGLRAYVLHWRRGFRCTWFEHDAPVTDVGAISLGHRDLLVVPELDVGLLAGLPADTPHVIFNQNTHLTWARCPDTVSAHYQSSPGLVGVLTVSAHNQAVLNHAFPHLTVRRLHLGLDPAVFHPGDAVRPRRIAYMPRRGQVDARQVLEILKARKSFAGWELVPLDGLSHEQVAAQLRHSRIFLAFTYQEGFGLPPAEAMACGNYVIGHHGYGGREFFRPAFSAPVDAGDVLGFVHAVEGALAADRADPDWCAARGRAAAAFIETEYSPSREREEVTAVYRELLEKQQRAPAAAAA